MKFLLKIIKLIKNALKKFNIILLHEHLFPFLSSLFFSLGVFSCIWHGSQDVNFAIWRDMLSLTFFLVVAGGCWVLQPPSPFSF